MRIAQTIRPVGDSTGEIDPASLGARCIGERLVAMARAAAAIHQAAVADHAATAARRPSTAVGEARP